MPNNTESITEIEAKNRTKKEEVRHYACAHYLSAVAYYLAADPKVDSLPILTEDGTYHHYFVLRPSLKDEMHAFILLPHDKTRKDIKVIFRGTDEANLKSQLINVETWGPGYLSFEQEKDKLFSHVEKALSYFEKDYQNIRLDVAGHSQGAAFSQLFVTECLKRRLESSCFDGLSNIQMSCLNSPGVPHSIAYDADNYLLKQLVKKPLKTRVRYGMVGGDPIQMAGLDMILAKLPYFFVEVWLMKVDKGLEGAWLDDINLANGLQIGDAIKTAYNAYLRLNGVHANVHFGAPNAVDQMGEINDDFSYRFYTNKKDEDISPMITEIYNKAFWTQYLTFPLKYLAYQLGSAFIANNSHYTNGNQNKEETKTDNLPQTHLRKI